jgi:RNA polymerase sigma-70 factor (ECF subfamily)
VSLDVDQLYRTHAPLVLRRCRALLKREDLALDAMQDVFVQVMRYANKWQPEYPAALLNRIATNVCLNRIRSQKRRPEEPSDFLYTIATTLEPDKTNILADLLQKLFGAEAVSSQTIAVLHYLDGLTLEEVAAEVGLSVSGVRKRLRTLRQRLHIMGEDHD